MRILVFTLLTIDLVITVTAAASARKKQYLPYKDRRKQAKKLLKKELNLKNGSLDMEILKANHDLFDQIQAKNEQTKLGNQKSQPAIDVKNFATQEEFLNLIKIFNATRENFSDALTEFESDVSGVNDTYNTLNNKVESLLIRIQKLQNRIDQLEQIGQKDEKDDQQSPQDSDTGSENLVSKEPKDDPEGIISLPESDDSETEDANLDSSDSGSGSGIFVPTTQDPIDTDKVPQDSDIDKEPKDDSEDIISLPEGSDSENADANLNSDGSGTGGDVTVPTSQDQTDKEKASQGSDTESENLGSEKTKDDIDDIISLPEGLDFGSGDTSLDSSGSGSGSGSGWGVFVPACWWSGSGSGSGSGEDGFSGFESGSDSESFTGTNAIVLA